MSDQEREAGGHIGDLFNDEAAVDELPLAPLTRDVLVPLWASRRPVAPGAVAE